MITNVREERLIVTSDSHIGSFFVNARPGLIRLLEFARAGGYNVCINGDGIDVLHSSLMKMTMEASELLREIKRLSTDMTIYYTIGNHDIILEHYLGDWGAVRLVPFLNVSSGGKRIRIEHGHLYDPFLMNYPALQPALTKFIGWCCRPYPPLFALEERIKRIRYSRLPRLFGRRNITRSGIELPDEKPSFIEAAEELAERGFDAVIFGHTHHHGVLRLNDNGATYFNTGAWSRHPHYAVIDAGEIVLKPWNGPLDV
jgi:UDP-2,3-diacylglucosamine pyrophosphatase LpxH